MKAILIPTEGLPEPVSFEGTDDLQRLVGGWIEAIDIGRHDATGYGNETAKLDGLAANPTATALVFPNPGEWILRRIENERHPGIVVVKDPETEPREPYIAGPLVVCGFDRRSGEHRPMPTDLAKELLA